MEHLQHKVGQVKEEIQKVVVGKEQEITLVLMTILAGGHVLLEDIPGVGKTTLALAFSKTLSLSYRRMQFTPDVLPADVTGFSMYSKQTDTFEYREGAVMCNLFLADEINRTSPKTQSALLEVMEEKRVTVDGVTHTLPDPFFVIATQNPLGSAGTQKLPESQLDRFMVKLSMGYPDKESEIRILKEETKDSLSLIQPVLTMEELKQAQQACEQIHVEDSMYQYIADLMAASRSFEAFQTGISPRGAKALLRMSRASAFLKGRAYVVPEDVLDTFVPVGVHRVQLSPLAKAQGKQETELLTELCGEVTMPKP